METKRCGGMCKQVKAVSDFNWKNKAKGVLFYACKECWNESNKKRYEENKSYYVTKASIRKTVVVKDNIDRMLQYLSTHPCVDCGETDPVVLQFDHVRGQKVREVSNLISRGNSWKCILSEIEKCQVRCANCHTRKTARQFGWYKSRSRGEMDITQPCEG